MIGAAVAARPHDSPQRVGVGRKLLRVFALQLAAISAAVVLGVLGSAKVLEDSLMYEALRGEADLFEERLLGDRSIAAPDTVNLTTYLASRNTIPDAFAALAPGYHQLFDGDSRILVLVRDVEGDRIVMRFEAGHVIELALYFGVIPISLVLLVVYITAFFAYRLSRRTVSPIIELAREVESLDLDNLQQNAFPDPEPGSPDDEVASLRRALNRLNDRVHVMLERERAFTRDASHELRTPLSVIHMAAGVLSHSTEPESREARTLQRIHRAVHDMQVMLDALLAMARHNTDGLNPEQFRVDEVIGDELKRIQLHLERRGIETRLVVESALELEGVPRLLGLVVDYLVRGIAQRCGVSAIEILVGPGYVSIDAIGPDHKRRVVNHRPAAEADGDETIVQRLSALAGWPLEDQQDLGCATLYFPNARTCRPELTTGQA